MTELNQAALPLRPAGKVRERRGQETFYVIIGNNYFIFVESFA